jgi:AcrR family transcriptional regulator
MSVEARRQQRSKDIIAATRQLFDQRGTREAQIEDIATALGINRAIIYRHFQTKEELFAVTLVDYLDELAVELSNCKSTDDPVADLGAQTDAFFAYGTRYPAFVDCAQSLLRYRGSRLLEDVSGPRLTELGASMYGCFAPLTDTLRRGNETGDFDVDDVDLAMNVFYTLGLGALNLVTFQKTLREVVQGLPSLEDLQFDIIVEDVKRAFVAVVRPRD